MTFAPALPPTERSLLVTRLLQIVEAQKRLGPATAFALNFQDATRAKLLLWDRLDEDVPLGVPTAIFGVPVTIDNDVPLAHIRVTRASGVADVPLPARFTD